MATLPLFVFQLVSMAHCQPMDKPWAGLSSSPWKSSVLVWKAILDPEGRKITWPPGQRSTVGVQIITSCYHANRTSITLRQIEAVINAQVDRYKNKNSVENYLIIHI